MPSRPWRKRIILAVTPVLILLLLFEARLLWKYSLQVPNGNNDILHLPPTPFSSEQVKRVRADSLRASVVELVRNNKNMSSSSINANTANAEAACRHGPRTSNLIQPKQLRNWTRTNATFLPHYDEPSELWDNFNNQPQREARCEFHVPLELVIHFPHALQNLYSCWSYWQYHIHQQQNTPSFWQGQIRPVLYIPKEFDMVDVERIQAWRQEPSNGYLGNVLRFLYDWGVVFRRVSLDSSRTSAKPRPFGNTTDGYAMYSLQHATALRNSMLEWLQLPSQVSCTRHAQITIVDRKSSRRIMHVETLRQALEDALSPEQQGRIPIVYFEDASFAAQMAVTSHTDILITPHGAQLASLPFLRPCASVLEIFPFRYCLPYFYGSLASAAGMDYHYMHLGNECMIEMEKRGQRRSANLCLDVNTIVQGVQQLVKEWKPCGCHDFLN